MKLRTVPVLLGAKLAVFLTCVLSCGVKPPPGPPEYDEQCVPSHDFYLQLAQMTVDLDDTIPTDSPEAARDWCRAGIETRGWTFVFRGDEDGPDWGALTGPNIAPVISMPANFDQRPVLAQAQLMCHEYAHTWSWDRMGDVNFGLTYVVRDGTWALEVIARRQQFRVWNALMPEVSDEIRRDKAEALMERLFEPPYNLDNPCFVQTGVEILLGD